MSSSFHHFIENVDFWDECNTFVRRQTTRLSSSTSEQLVYYFIKDSLLDKPFVIKSKRMKFSDTFVTVVKVKNESSANLDYYTVRRDNNYKIIIDKIIPSYRKRCQILIENLDNIYKKPENTFVSFLQKYNVVQIFKE
jgi:hypothetical protein